MFIGQVSTGKDQQSYINRGRFYPLCFASVNTLFPYHSSKTYACGPSTLLSRKADSVCHKQFGSLLSSHPVLSPVPIVWAGGTGYWAEHFSGLNSWLSILETCS